MAESDIPPAVEQLIRRRLSSASQVEVLLLLRTDATRAWSPEEVGRALVVQPTAALVHLEELVASGLVEGSGDPPTYRFAGPNRERKAVDGLAEAWSRRKVQVVRMLFSAGAPGSATAFADAFRLRRDD